MVLNYEVLRFIFIESEQNVMNIQGIQSVGAYQIRDHQRAQVSRVSHGHCSGFETDIVSGQTAPVVAIS